MTYNGLLLWSNEKYYYQECFATNHIRFLFPRPELRLKSGTIVSMGSVWNKCVSIFLQPVPVALGDISLKLSIAHVFRYPGIPIIRHCLVPETPLSLNVSLLRLIPLAYCQENLEEWLMWSAYWESGIVESIQRYSTVLYIQCVECFKRLVR